MNNGILSQEEIDALLKGESRANANGLPPENDLGLLNDMEKDALGEIGNICMGTSATTLSSLLGKKVRITTPQVTTVTKARLQSKYPLPYVVVEVSYREGLQGTNVLVMKQEDSSVIADLMMGGDGTGQRQLDELALSAVSEAMNQMMGSATTSLASMFNKRIDINPPHLSAVDFGSKELGEILGQDFEQLVHILFRMEIDQLVDSEIMQIIPLANAKEMVVTLMGSVPEADIQDVSQPQVSPPPPVPSEPQPIQTPAQVNWEVPAPTVFEGPRTLPEAPSAVKKGQVAVQPVQFMSLNAPNIQQEPRNIDLILDVPLDITVELGKTRKSIKEILEMGPGSIIQLDKLAGEPVDLLVNGKLIAKGEVVVIDETYGIRVTTIISPMDRMARLQ